MTRGMFVLALAVGVLGMPPMLTAQDLPGGTIRYAENIRPEGLDPVRALTQSNKRLVALMFESLIAAGEADGEWEPKLAMNWEEVDRRTVIFTLRPDAVWHDGQPVTAEDVRWSYEMYKNPLSNSPLLDVIGQIRVVRVLSENKVEFRFKRITLNKMGIVAAMKILPKHAFDDEIPYMVPDDPFRTERPVGSGPFRFTLLSIDDRYSLTREENHSPRNAFLDGIEMIYLPDLNSIETSLFGRAIQLVIEMGRQGRIEAKESGRYFVMPYQSNSYSYIAFNLKNPIMAHHTVRKAMTMAVNKTRIFSTYYGSSIIDTSYGGGGYLITGPFAPSSWAYNIDVAHMPYDARRAKLDLDAAGIVDTDHDGIRELNGQPLKFELLVPVNPNERPIETQVAVACRDDWREVGIMVSIKNIPVRAWNERVIDRSDFDLALGRWTFAAGANIAPLFRTGGKFNFIGYSEPSVDELFDRAASSMDTETVRWVYHRIHKRIRDDCPYIFLWSPRKYAVFDRDITGVRIHPYSFFDYVVDWRISRQ